MGHVKNGDNKAKNGSGFGYKCVKLDKEGKNTRSANDRGNYGGRKRGREEDGTDEAEVHKRRRGEGVAGDRTYIEAKNGGDRMPARSEKD